METFITEIERYLAFWEIARDENRPEPATDRSTHHIQDDLGQTGWDWMKRETI